MKYYAVTEALDYRGRVMRALLEAEDKFALDTTELLTEMICNGSWRKESVVQPAAVARKIIELFKPDGCRLFNPLNNTGAIRMIVSEFLPEVNLQFVVLDRSGKYADMTWHPVERNLLEEVANG